VTAERTRHDPGVESVLVDGAKRRKAFSSVRPPCCLQPSSWKLTPWRAGTPWWTSPHYPSRLYGSSAMTAEVASEASAMECSKVMGRLSFAVLLVSQLLATTAFMFVAPLMPLYVQQLGVQEAENAAAWAGS
jgi:hypothetical protein